MVPRAHRALANVLWLNLLFQRGAVTVDHYLGSFSSSTVDLKKPPADVDAEFRREVGKAIELAEQRVAAHLLDALRDRPAMLGLERNGLEDEEIESSLNEVGRSAHGVSQKKGVGRSQPRLSYLTPKLSTLGGHVKSHTL